MRSETHDNILFTREEWAAIHDDSYPIWLPSVFDRVRTVVDPEPPIEEDRVVGGVCLVPAGSYLEGG